MTEQDIKDHPAWKLIPGWEIDTGSLGQVKGYFFLNDKTEGGMKYCIDYSGDTARIEIWRTTWTPIHKGFKDAGEALQALAMMIATDAIKP